MRARSETPPSAATVSFELRKQALRDGLPAAAGHLKSRRADLIGEAVISDCVALDWLEWHGGGLRLTEVGRNICLQSALGQARGGAAAG